MSEETGADRRRGSRAAEPEMTVTRRTTPAAARTSGTVTEEPPMTDSPRMRLAAGEPKTRPRGRVLAPARYRHPGDVIRLIAAVSVLAAAAVIAVLLPALLRPAAADHRGRARDRGRAGADRPGPGDGRGGGPGAAGRRAAVPPVPGAGHRGGRVRGGGGADGRNHLPGRAGRLGAARRAAPGFLADRRRFPRSGRPGGTGGGRGGRRAVAEPAMAPGGLGHAAADRRGPAGHRRAAAHAAGAGAGGRGHRGGGPAGGVRGAGPADGPAPGWQRRCARVACRSAR